MEIKSMKSFAGLPLRVLPWLLVLSSCAEPGPEATAYTVRDSAGVRIVEDLEVGASNETWRPSSAPILRIGSDGAGPNFQDVQAGAFLSDGGFVVADAGARQLYRFTESGDLAARFGASGEGPGEFTRLRNVLALGGDSVLVPDWGSLRVSLFAGDEFVADWRFAASHKGAFYDLLLRTDDGRFGLVPTSFRIEGIDEPRWGSFPVLRATADFASVDTIVELEMQGPQSRNPIKYYGYAVRAGDRIAYARMDQPEVRWLDLDGKLAQIVRWKAPVQQADEEVWEEYEGWFRELLRSQDPAVLDQILGEARRDFGGQLPYFRMAYGDEPGNVWLSTYSISVFQASQYVILAADGTSAHSVEFPEELRILALTADRVLAVAEDDLDVQTVVVYRLEKPAEG